jgi:hypothetical protein
MSTEFQWEGHNIQIVCQPMPKYLWMATETVAKVDDREVCRGGGFGFTDKIRGKFGNNDLSHELALELKMDVVTLVSVPYKLQIDENVISEGRLRIDNWPLFFIPTIVILGVCCSATVVLLLTAVNNLPR